MNTLLKQSEPGLSAAGIEYPTMRLSGDGWLTPSSLKGSRAVSCDIRLYEDGRYQTNQFVVAFDDVAVFFPIRRTSRMHKVLEKLDLALPTYHHAIALAMKVSSTPVTGTIVVGHSAIGAGPTDRALMRLCLTVGKEHSLLSIRAAHVFPKAVWGMGLRR